MDIHALRTSFDKSILNIIDIHAYYIYLIIRDLKVECTCVTHATSQADITCPKCLGTGYKITIRKVKAAAQDVRLPTTFRNNKFMLTRSFFIKGDFGYKEDDIIMDNYQPYMVVEVQEGIGQEGSIPYRRVASIKKKFDSKIFLENFKAIVNRK